MNAPPEIDRYRRSSQNALNRFLELRNGRHVQFAGQRQDEDVTLPPGRHSEVGIPTIHVVPS